MDIFMLHPPLQAARAGPLSTTTAAQICPVLHRLMAVGFVTPKI